MSIAVGTSGLFSFGCIGVASSGVGIVTFTETGATLLDAETTTGADDSDANTDDVIVVNDDVICDVSDDVITGCGIDVITDCEFADVTADVIAGVTDAVITDCRTDDVIDDVTSEVTGVINDVTTGVTELVFELVRLASPDRMFLIGGVIAPDKVLAGGATVTVVELLEVSFMFVSIATVSVFGAAAAIVSFTVVLTTLSAVIGARNGVVGRPSPGPGALTGDCVLAP